VLLVFLSPSSLASSPLVIYLPAAPWSSIWPSPTRAPACCIDWPPAPTPGGAPRAPPLARGFATCPSAPVALAPPRALVLLRSAKVAQPPRGCAPTTPRCCGSHTIHSQRSCRPVQSGPGHRHFSQPLGNFSARLGYRSLFSSQGGGGRFFMQAPPPVAESKPSSSRQRCSIAFSNRFVAPCE